MAWFEVGGGNHISLTFHPVNEGSFLESRLRGRDAPEVPFAGPVCSSALGEFRGGVWEEALCFLPSSPLPFSHAGLLSLSPPLPDVSFIQILNFIIAKVHRGFHLPCLQECIIHCHRPHKLNRLHPFPVALGSGQTATFLGWWIGSFLPSLSQDTDFMRLSCDRLKSLWIKQNPASAHRNNLKSSLSWVGEQNLVKTLSRGLRWSEWGIWRNCFWSFLFMHRCCWHAHTQNCVSIIFINMQPQTQWRRETHVSRANVIKRDIWTLPNARQTCSSKESWSWVSGLPRNDTGVTPWTSVLFPWRVENLLNLGFNP